MLVQGNVGQVRSEQKKRCVQLSVCESVNKVCYTCVCVYISSCVLSDICVCLYKCYISGMYGFIAICSVLLFYVFYFYQ